MHLWKDICENKLLAHATLILFLNKVFYSLRTIRGSFYNGYAILTYNFLLQRDVLKATLKSGVLVKKYVPTYGELPNDVENVTKC
jgi:hypothetical protein